MGYQMEKCQRNNQFHTETLSHLQTDLIYADQQNDALTT